MSYYFLVYHSLVILTTGCAKARLNSVNDCLHRRQPGGDTFANVGGRATNVANDAIAIDITSATNATIVIESKGSP